MKNSPGSLLSNLTMQKNSFPTSIPHTRTNPGHYLDFDTIPSVSVSFRLSVFPSPRLPILCFILLICFQKPQEKFIINEKSKYKQKYWRTEGGRINYLQKPTINRAFARPPRPLRPLRPIFRLLHLPLFLRPPLPHPSLSPSLRPLRPPTTPVRPRFYPAD